MALDAETRRVELPPSVKDRLGFLLVKNHLALLGRVETRLEPPGLTGRHYGCLTVIGDEGPLTQQRLGERMGVDRTTIVAVVDLLELNGFVERHRNPEDRRAYALEITPKGRAWQKRATETIIETEKEFLAPLSPAERQQLVELLQRVLMSQPAKLVADAAVEVRAR
jgi:DNA-binding MarR family transcriptional regulator